MKSYLMSLFVCILFLFSGNNAFSQARDFDGLWKGKINLDNGETVEFTIFIEDNNVYATYIDSDGDLAKDLSKEIIWSNGYGQQLTFVWTDTGGIWNETQVFSFVWISADKLSCHYMRHVSNESDDYDGNTDWGNQGEGFFYQE